jgi:hypothetical protein
MPAAAKTTSSRMASGGSSGTHLLPHGIIGIDSKFDHQVFVEDVIFVVSAFYAQEGLPFLRHPPRIGIFHKQQLRVIYR